jgi:hypothetical protein
MNYKKTFALSGKFDKQAVLKVTEYFTPAHTNVYADFRVRQQQY